ncbi:MAG: phosphatase PAP2 family protein [Halanaerobiales bacterium]
MYYIKSGVIRKYIFITVLLLIFTFAWNNSTAAVNPLDGNVKELMIDLQNPFLDDSMDLISSAGNKEIGIPLTLFIPGEKAKIDTFKALAFTGAVTFSLKYLIGRTRPSESEYDYKPFTDSNSSFPSGHATGAFALATVMEEYYPEYKYYFYTFASLVAFSRVYKDRHWTSDVLAGAAVGHYGAKFTLYKW